MLYLIWRLPAVACEVELKLGRVKLLGQANKQHKTDENLNLSDSCLCFSPLCYDGSHSSRRCWRGYGQIEIQIPPVTNGR